MKECYIKVSKEEEQEIFRRGTGLDQDEDLGIDDMERSESDEYT